MAEIIVKSPALRDRELSTYRFVAEVSFGTGAGCTCLSAIDIPGLTITSCGATVILSGFEAESDHSLDSARNAGLNVIESGTLVNVTAAILHNGPVSGVISGAAGSRIVTYTLTSFASSTDSVANGEIEFILPIKNKDF
jgi:hypothetical protein